MEENIDEDEYITDENDPDRAEIITDKNDPYAVKKVRQEPKANLDEILGSGSEIIDHKKQKGEKGSRTWFKL